MTTSAPERRSKGLVVLVASIGMVLPLIVGFRALQAADGDPTIFVAFGVQATPTREYAEARLGEVYLRDNQGHDGKYFFVQANDPWLLNPADNATVLDRPLYRSQRMLYPVLAGGLGLFGPKVIVWSMLMVNLLAMGIGTWVVSRIAMEMGGSPWWGLAFALNLGFISEILIGGAGVVAAVAAFGAVLQLIRDRPGWSVALLVLAALAREAMLIVVAGTAVWLWFRRSRRFALVTALVPLLAVAMWAAYLRTRIGDGRVVSDVQEIGWPLVGFVKAFSQWMEDPISLTAGLATMILFILYVRRVLMSRHLVGLAFIGFVALGLVFTEQVWRSYFDITRAVAPIITSFVLLVFLGSSTAERSAKSELEQTS